MKDRNLFFEPPFTVKFCQEWKFSLWCRQNNFLHCFACLQVMLTLQVPVCRSISHLEWWISEILKLWNKCVWQVENGAELDANYLSISKTRFSSEKPTSLIGRMPLIVSGKRFTADDASNRKNKIFPMKKPSNSLSFSIKWPHTNLQNWIDSEESALFILRCFEAMSVNEHKKKLSLLSNHHWEKSGSIKTWGNYLFTNC